MENQAYKGIARVYTQKKQGVRNLLEKYGAGTGTKEQELYALAQLLDAPGFAREFWALDTSRSNFLGQLIGAATSIIGGVQQRDMQKAQLSENQKQRQFEADMQDSTQDFQREQNYYQSLMRDKEIAWSSEQSYNATINGIMNAVNEQEKLESQKNTTYILVIGGVLAATVLATALKPKKQ